MKLMKLTNQFGDREYINPLEVESIMESSNGLTWLTTRRGNIDEYKETVDVVKKRWENCMDFKGK